MLPNPFLYLHIHKSPYLNYKIAINLNKVILIYGLPFNVLRTLPFNFTFHYNIFLMVFALIVPF